MTPAAPPAGFDPEPLLSVARAHRPVPAAAGGIYFGSDMAGVAQVYRQGGPDRFPVRLAPSQERTLPVAETPLGLLVRRDRGGDETWQLGLVGAGGDFLRLTRDERAIHAEVRLSPDGRRAGLARNPGGQADWVLGVLDLETGEIEDWLDRGGYWRWLGWNQAGTVGVVASYETGLRNTCFLLERGRPPRPLAAAARLVSGVTWQSGRLYLVATAAASEYAALVEVDPLSGKVLRALVDEPHDVLAAVFTEAGDRVAVVVNEGAYDSVRVLDAATGAQLWRAPLDPGVVYVDNAGEVAENLTWSADGERLFISWESPVAAAEIFELPSGRRWTAAAGEPISGLPRPRAVSYVSFDGLEVPALHFRAAGAASGPRPTVVYFHGGPESQFRGNFQPPLAMWTAAGYDVLAPNVRGSTGYGVGYGALDDRDLRWDSVRDGCAAGHWLRDQGLAGPLIAMGRSYGGFMTLAVLVQEPGLWDAGIDIFGIADWHSFFHSTSGWRRSMRTPEYGEPEGPDGEFLAAFSPLRRAASISAHLMLIHGRNDVRVPLAESEQIHSAVPSSELLVLDDEGHDIARHGNRVTAYRGALDFVRRRLGG